MLGSRGEPALTADTLDRSRDERSRGSKMRTRLRSDRATGARAATLRGIRENTNQNGRSLERPFV
jgi:hypothetical protein